MDGEQDAETGDLGTDFPSGSKSLSDLGNLSQPDCRKDLSSWAHTSNCLSTHHFWGAVSTGMGNLLAQGQGRKGLDPKENCSQLTFFTSLPSSQDDRQGLWG